MQSTPKLWASFEVDVPDIAATDSTRHPNRINSMNLWLERSRKNPLSVRIRHNPVGRVPDYRSAHILAALIPHAHRWKDIHFHVPSSSIGLLQESQPHNFPALRSVTLEMRGLWNSIVPLDVRALGIPWGQLTGLSLYLDYNHLLTLNECLDILGQCRSLSRCTLNADCTFDTDPSVRADKLTLPTLKGLHLILQYGDQAQNGMLSTNTPELALVSFLEQLELAQLEALSIEWLIQSNRSSMHWTDTHSRFVTILSSLTPTLQSLSLAYLPITELEVLDCLSQLPNLTYLSIRSSLAEREHDPVGDKLLRACTLRPDQTHHGFLHLLETVHLQCHGARCSASLITAFIESRWDSTADDGADTHFRSFRFVSMQPITVDMQTKVDVWAKQGLDVVVERVSLR